MPADRDRRNSAIWIAQEHVAVNLEGTAVSVRAALDSLMRHDALADLCEEARGTLWTVLAEVLNNIVEHAYAEYPGDILFRLWCHGDSVAVEVTDHGLPMPGLEMPEGRLPVARRAEDAAEGGYGWYLIRSLTDWLIYDRVGEANRLRFSMGRD